MNKIAVNPTQFITCRLCLDELGNYQIVPSVKEQIKFCFDINVEPFDGLPQLICQKCEIILENVFKIKKKYLEKQEELRAKIYNPQELATSNEGNVSAAQQPKESPKDHESKINKEISKSKKRKPCISSSDSSDLEYTDTLKNTRTNGGSCSNEEKDITWSASYTKQFVCKICSSHWYSVKALKSHIYRKHSIFYKKYGHILKRHCQVTLYKTDGKRNITGSKTKVVYDKNKIIQNVNADYHIIYTSTDYRGDEKYDVQKSKITSYISSDSSDDDIVVKRNKRTRRLYSRSSNETVVLDSNSNMPDNDENESRNSVQPSEACINLDDSESDAESATIADKKKSTNKNGCDLQIAPVLYELVTSSGNKYTKKRYHDTTLGKNPSDIANKLQHKIFSIGRKIINKRIGVNCIPLLRFMEYKELDIAWLCRAIVKFCPDSNHIRIMPRRKQAHEKTEDETGWGDYHPCQSYDESYLSKNKEESHEDTNSESSDTEVGNSIRLPNMVVMPEANTVHTDTRKLLNANPVANPKQLPKKFPVHEVKLAKIISKPDDNNSGQEIEPGLYMPIITSTTSLAVPISKQNDNAEPSMISEIDSTTDKQQTDPPRIKVKDVSKLMSEETLNRMQNTKQNAISAPMQNTVQAPMHIPVNIISKGIPLSLQKVNAVSVSGLAHNIVNMQPNGVTNLIAPTPAWQNEFMILDTIELPNTRTNSPYMYLKKLLQTHDITLLDTCVELNANFHCLIKFKVQYKQDVQNQPVILCLALYCSNNVFCFKVKDRNNEDLDITKISANWQWEILKIFKGEVVSKLLNNAQVIGQNVFEFTNTFLCLLKSINVKNT